MTIFAIKHTVTGLYMNQGEWCEEPEWISDNHELNAAEKLERSMSNESIVFQQLSDLEYRARTDGANVAEAKFGNHWIKIRILKNRHAWFFLDDARYSYDRIRDYLLNKDSIPFN